MKDKREIFFKLLVETKKRSKIISRNEILNATGWEESSWKTSLSKGTFSSVLRKKDGFLEIIIPDGMTLKAFLRKTSQSKRNQGLGSGFKSLLAIELLKKSRDNFILALELYNRPSLTNRIEGFCLLFVAGWESLLKSYLIERDGEDSIFKPKKSNHHRETIGITEAIRRSDMPTSVQKNLEKIKYFRDRAAHLTIPESAFLTSRIFQAGVFNYLRYFSDFVEEPVFSNLPPGLISLVSSKSPFIDLSQKYGKKTGQEMADFMESLERDILENVDEQYAISLEHRVVISNKSEEGDIQLVQSIEGDGHTLPFIIKTKDVSITHPFKTTQCVSQIREKVGERLRQEINFNSHDFLVAIWDLKWKKSNNRHHHRIESVNTSFYSNAAVDKIVEIVISDPEYLKKKRESYKNRKR